MIIRIMKELSKDSFPNTIGAIFMFPVVGLVWILLGLIMPFIVVGKGIFYMLEKIKRLNNTD